MVKFFISNPKLVTLDVTYRMPDFGSVLQVFVWQEYDSPPDFPRCIKFIKRWKESIDGKIVMAIARARGLEKEFILDQAPEIIQPEKHFIH